MNESDGQLLKITFINTTVTGHLPTLFADLRAYIAGTSSQVKKLSYSTAIEKFNFEIEWKEPKRLKVPKREIFDRSDFPDFYIIKSLCVGDFGVKIKKKNSKNN